jgi:chitin synthase
MNFLSKVMFDERMTPLEFDLFFKLWTISGILPDKYEAVLMLDADTLMFPHAMSHLVAR